MRRAVQWLSILGVLGAVAPARAATSDGTLAVGASADSSAAPAGPRATTPSADAPAEPPPEAPPPLPHKKGIVVESSLGALGFVGQFRHVAPTAPWLHTDAGYELFKWLYLFGEGELAFTDTSVAQDASKVRAFPIFAFGGGARLTVHLTERVAVFGQGDLGLMKADAPTRSLAIIGYPSAENLNPYFGGRLGVEWYQIDRHLALGLMFGVRDAVGFARSIGGDTPLMWDGGATLRYTFPL